MLIPLRFIGILCVSVQLTWSQNISNLTVPCSIPSFSSAGVIVAGGTGQGPQPQQLSFPYGIHVDSNGSLYIADTGNDRIQLWHPSATVGITIAGGQGFGSNASQLDGARGVYAYSAAHFIVLDTGNQRMQRFNRSSAAPTIGVSIMTNLPVSCRDMFVETMTNTIYVSDMHNHRVLRLPNGTVIAGGNGVGNQSNQLYYPAGLFATPAGVVYVADSFNHRVQMWAPSATVGITVAGGNGRGSASNQLDHPMHVIYMASTGNLIVTDTGNARIQVWAPNATCGITILRSQFLDPVTSAFDVTGQNLYVVDRSGNQVKRFALLSSSSICIPANCSIVPLTTMASSTTTTTTVAMVGSSLSASGASDLSSTPSMSNAGLPSWSIVVIVVGLVTIVMLISSVVVIAKIVRSNFSPTVEPIEEAIDSSS